MEELSERWVHEFCTDGLELVNFVGPSLLRLGGNGSISSGLDYQISQAWSAKLHAHPAQVDGIRYVSRQLNDQCSVVVFDRAREKLVARSCFRLLDHPEAPDALAELGVCLGLEG